MNFHSIGLFTDYGYKDHYLGQVKARLYAGGNGLPVYDLMTEAPCFRPRAAGILLKAILDGLPDYSAVVAVVDPGVGTDRRALLVRGARHLVVGPDNGLLAAYICSQPVEALEILWRPEQMSMTFHGRDLFAPLMLRYLAGLPLQCGPLQPDEVVGVNESLQLAEIIHVDHYGSLITGISLSHAQAVPAVRLHGHLIEPAATFAAVPVGRAFCYRNSIGLLEIACNQASAAENLRASLGDRIQVLP